jgi:flagellar hook protein FlgE
MMERAILRANLLRQASGTKYADPALASYPDPPRRSFFTMSLFGAMNTAISGLDAQAAAFTNISDNVANSQTTGFKSVNTNFTDYLTDSNATINQSGSVVTTPLYQNDVQGTIQQSPDPTALAISGPGFFQVSESDGTTPAGLPILSPQPYFTRAGDFALNANGYLVNGAGQFLNGWAADPQTGQLNTASMVPIHISAEQAAPIATSNVNLTANVPATPSASSVLSSQINVYDAKGTSHQLQLNWTQNGPNAWTLSLSSPDQVGGPAIGTVDLTFNDNGTLATLANATGSAAISNSPTSAVLNLTPNLGDGSQPISLNLGTYNVAGGVTQYAGNDYTTIGLGQNGAPPGNFTGISTSVSGDITANYENGQSQLIAHIPVVTFENSNSLQRVNGQAFTATADSGASLLQNAGANGAGTLVTGSVEASNVDIATELAKLIVAQQAYGANAKMITTAQQMLETTIALKQ